MNTEKEQECLIMLNGEVIGKMRRVNMPVNFTVMNDETYLLCYGRENPEEVRDEVLQAYKRDKAKKAASMLVAEHMKATGEKSFFNWWKRVSRAENQALLTAKLLSDQALNLESAKLCAHWCRVRIVIKERSYL